MAWQTPIGQRVLQSKELRLYACALASLTDDWDSNFQCFTDFNPLKPLPERELWAGWFYTLHAMIDPSVPALPLTPIIELVAAAPLLHLLIEVEVEVDQSGDKNPDDRFRYLWRKLLKKAMESVDEEYDPHAFQVINPKSRDIEAWICLAVEFSDRIGNWQDVSGKNAALLPEMFDYEFAFTSLLDQLPASPINAQSSDKAIFKAVNQLLNQLTAKVDGFQHPVAVPP